MDTMQGEKGSRLWPVTLRSGNIANSVTYIRCQARAGEDVTESREGNFLVSPPVAMQSSSGESPMGQTELAWLITDQFTCQQRHPKK